MSFQERRSLVNLIGTILISVIYTAFMIQRYPDADPFSAEVLRFWGAFFLVLIPVSIVAKIVVYIVFYILNAIATRQEEPAITDERDKVIEARAQGNANNVFLLGFFLGMVSLALGLPPAVMFSILICSGVVSEIISDISQFYFYRRGF